MFRTTYDSRGKPQGFYDGEFAQKQADLQRARSNLRTTNQSLDVACASIQELNESVRRGNTVDEWRRQVINAVANEAQDQYALSKGYKAALDLLLANPGVTIEQVKSTIEAARKTASGDGTLLKKTVEIQSRLKPRGIV